MISFLLWKEGGEGKARLADLAFYRYSIAFEPNR